ncbi:dTDP-4-dehydrorhamnose reductase [Microvirga thermotolerans]|uniref:dTDP-4-dehydrorhamnose reductase n=1 Tax=Microvirga thermotolerans TaxID=2651334 RepID=A0A5P9JZD9_9HYPH|nr:dTDP-4-dehydrorhamnose reductase [Microvirga thermotolerans]QFU18212.1 dTDP-4-dehydrorhamnose reductase [Microvirga thermotolerans]
MRILVVGREGQVARALEERAQYHGADVVLLGRPALDLLVPEMVVDTLSRMGGDLIVNAAAYTAVDQAEQEPELARAINAFGAGTVAHAAALIGVPVVQISTDYVFDGSAPVPYREDAHPNPIGAYGMSKLLGERAVAERTEDHVILRTAWVYSPFGKNFVKTMLRLAQERDEISVVEDQVGSPTSALDLADGILRVSRELLEHPGEARLRGIFHMTGSGSASWAEFAEAIFTCSSRLGGPTARVRRITTAEYPTPARRPLQSQLDNRRLNEAYGIALPHWRASLDLCVSRLLAGAGHQER